MTPLSLTISTLLLLSTPVLTQDFFAQSDITADGALTCKLSQKPPTNIQSKNGLNLCTQYATNTCCTALHDRLIFAYMHTDS